MIGTSWIWKALMGCMLVVVWAGKSDQRPTKIKASALVALTDPNAYPKDYFRSPIDGVIRPTGTFGELRPGHFHSGLDIKSTTGGVGEPVRATADGFVSQIKVLSSGYGNVLYLKHPNGYTTVYAHLDRFAPEIQAYVKEQQYKRERFQVVLSTNSEQFKVKKGQIIAYLGNSGGSSGPHLHFEIRNTATQKALNPLLFGLPVDDHLAPDIRDMKVYVLNERREVLAEQALPIVKLADGSYHIKGDTLRIKAERVGFAVKSYDRQDYLNNDNGIYALRLSVDEQLAFEWKSNELDFDETRYLNAHIDYGARQRYGAWFHRCFVLPGDLLSAYTPTERMGAIGLKPGQYAKMHLEIADAAGNQRDLSFWVGADAPLEAIYSKAYQFIVNYDRETKIDLGDVKLQIPKGAVYETLYFNASSKEASQSGVYSKIYTLQDEQTPLQKYVAIQMRPSNLPARLRKKAVIARVGSGKPTNCGGDWENELLSTRVRDFGNYCIMADTVPPTIVPVVFDKDMRRKSNMSFRINDNFEVGGKADDLKYKGQVDGNWVLFEFDAKRDRLTYTFDEKISAGLHQLRLEVSDDRGNTTVFERSFTR